MECYSVSPGLALSLIIILASFMNKFEYCLLDAANGFFSGPDYQELTNQLHILGSQGWGSGVGGATLSTPNQARGLLITFKRELLG
jgi:hypothetical protein